LKILQYPCDLQRDPMRVCKLPFSQVTAKTSIILEMDCQIDQFIHNVNIVIFLQPGRLQMLQHETCVDTRAAVILSRKPIRPTNHTNAGPHEPYTSLT
jgi:hypothetical protein